MDGWRERRCKIETRIVVATMCTVSSSSCVEIKLGILPYAFNFVQLGAGHRELMNGTERKMSIYLMIKKLLCIRYCCACF